MILENNFKTMQIKILIALFFISSSCFSQSFNELKTPFANFVKRMYNDTKFEGVKVVDDYENQYFISVLSLEKAKYNSPSIMHRVAQVKAQSQANLFFNGSSISTDFIIKTTERKNRDSINTKTIEIIESIKENANGFTKGLELLTNFDNADGKRMVYIFYRELIKN